MDSLIDKFLDKFWLTPISVPIVWILAIVASVPNLPDSFDNATWKTYVLIPAFAITVIGYTVYCIVHNMLPRAKDLQSSVLFIIDAENDQLFHDVEKKLASEFEDFTSREGKENFHAICVEKQKIKKYDLHKSESVVELLHRVNCIFFIFVKYRVDSVTNAEEFSMQIDFGILHGEIEEKARKLLLQTDMNNLRSPIKRRKFVKSDTLDEMTFTAITLSIICKYVIGLTMLLTGNLQKAYTLFHSLKGELRQDDPSFIAPGFEAILNNRLFLTCMAIATYDQELFFQNKSDSLLQDMNNMIEEANAIQPNTYSYFLIKAYILVAQGGDMRLVKDCIEMCKKDKHKHDWRYSEAFILAYEGRAAMTIYRKYNQAFKYNQHLNRIVDYIEYILDNHPDKTSLHLAAALVYDEIGDKILSEQHFNQYFASHDDDRLKKVLVEKKKWTPQRGIE